jgi:hypothetical protein
MDIRKIIDRRAVQQRKGLLSDAAAEIQKLVAEWQDVRKEAELDQATIDREVQTMEAKLNKYNVPVLGDIQTQCEDGAFRILVCQMGGCLGREIREMKIEGDKKIDS